jgi:3-oxoacyl-[acyl-carrier-protein] synthase II
MSSRYNNRPAVASRAYDKDRDGFVIAGGAGVVALEELEHAKARGARIHAEVVGYGTNSDGNHVTQPSPATMAAALRLAMEDANLPAEAIGFVSGQRVTSGTR